MLFIDLEKAYDRFPREELFEGEDGAREVCSVDKGDVKNRVRSCVGTKEGFEVKVGLHQGSALSTFLFNIVFDVLTRGVR